MQLTLSQPGGEDYAHPITTGTPGFSDLPTALHRYKRLLDELQLQKHGFPYLEENKKDRWEKFVSKMDHYATCMQEIKNFFCMFAFHYNSSLKEGIPRKLQLEQARILIKKHLQK